MYRFETTEQNNQKANDYETKALLYLLSFRKDSKSIETFAIDCFNDVTGCNKNFTILWDIQSKNVQSLTPKKIGIALITLFCNYEHDFPFEHFILIMPKLKEGYLLNENSGVFQFDNFQNNQKEKIKKGLAEEYFRRKNLNSEEERIKEFLEKITFVIGNKSKIEYIKNITKFKTNIMQDKFFEDIFNEIRDIQTAYKNIIKYQDKYLGDNSNTGNLISNLPLSEHGYVFEIDFTNLGLIINYHVTDWYVKENLYLEKALIYNTISIFHLIENVDYITYNFTANSYKVTKDKVKEVYPNYNEIKKEEKFNTYVEKRMEDNYFIEKYVEKMFEENKEQ